MTILLTGRAERNFADTIKRMVAAKKLVFDMICLKPSVGPSGQRLQSTQMYKQTLLKDIIFTYKEIEELKIYEDRPKQYVEPYAGKTFALTLDSVQAFRRFIDEFKKELYEHPSSVPRKDLSGEVVQVYDTAGSLDPLAETKEVQRMLNNHNLQRPPPRLLLKRTVFYLGYLLSQNDADNLLTLLNISLNETDLKLLANNIMITPRPSTAAILEKVGGMGAKQIWRVTSFGSFNNLVFAARVSPIQSSDTYFTENPFPMVVLAIRKGGKAVDSTKIFNWTPVPSDKQFVFETTVGEKVQLRIEQEMEGQSEYDSLFPPKSNQNPYVGGNNKRKHPVIIDNEDRPGGPRDGEPRRVSDRYRGSAHPHRGGRGGRDRERDHPRSRSPPLRNRDRDRDRDNHRNGPPPPRRGERDRGDRRDRRDGPGRDGGRDRDGGGRDRDRDRDGGGGGGGGGGRNRARNVYRSLDDVSADGPRNERFANGHPQPSYDDLMPHAGPEGYGAGFLPLGAGSGGGGQAQGRSGVGAAGAYDGAEDLHY